MKYFCLTHSTRKMAFHEASLNYLTRRYASPDRLKNLPPLESLPNEYCSEYIGNVSVWKTSDDFMQRPVLIAFMEKNYKIQHAAIHKDKLILCGTAFIEIYNIQDVIDNQGSATCERIISHPWFSGGHTVVVNKAGELVVTCSGSDAILFFDLSGNLVRYYRMPEQLYGHNYDLKLTDDTRLHYIRNDFQLTHINCASEYRDGYLVSALIQGLIGFFDRNGQYTEISRGFVGCHGVRPQYPETDSFYFSDSTRGTLVEMNFKGVIKRRFSLESKWLHDALCIGENHYMFVPSDLNTMEFWNIQSEEKIWEVKCDIFGATSQFLSNISDCPFKLGEKQDLEILLAQKYQKKVSVEKEEKSKVPKPFKKILEKISLLKKRIA